MITNNEISKDNDSAKLTVKNTDSAEEETNISQRIQESEETNVQRQNIITATKYPEKRNAVVTFASTHTNIPFNDDREPSCLAQIDEDDDLNLVDKNNIDELYSSNTHLLKSNISKKSTDKFTQTFFKSMINLSNRRFIEIINTSVNYDDKSLVFYCRSDELLP